VSRPFLQEDKLKILTENFENYMGDESNTKSAGIEAVYIPDSDSEIFELLKKNTPLTVYAGGTGIVAGGIAEEGSVISVENFKFLHIDQDLQEVSAGAGVTLSELTTALSGNNLWYPADSTEQSATIGGNAATCAWGTRSYKYGSIRNYINAVHVIIPGLGKLRLARGENKAENLRFPGEIKSGGKTYCFPGAGKTAINLADTVSEFPKKNSAGYYMKKEMDLVDLIIGSEGTLGIITLLEFNVLKKPCDITAFMSFFRNENEAFAFVKKVKSLKGDFSPCSVEFMDLESLKLLKNHSFNVRETGPAVFLEIETPASGNPDGAVDFAADVFRASGIREEDVVVSSTKEKRDYIYSIREGLPRAVNSQIRLAGQKKAATDFSVNDGEEGELLEIYMKMRSSSGIKTVLFGHAGDNNLHLNFIPKSAQEYAKAREICETAAREVGALKGSIAAEHGVGKMKKHMLKYMYKEDTLSAMREIKHKFDPEIILNRGSVI
jgi:D-lactate dehydrogenase (cytochrome)